jgi:hypothetical protein
MIHRLGWLIAFFAAAAAPVAARARPARPQTRPAATRPDGDANRPTSPTAAKPNAALRATSPRHPKCPPAGREHIEACRRRAQALADAAAEFVPKLHRVTTPHFDIWSPWDAAGDHKLARVCERMYAAMCRQFDIPPREKVWVGKCPVYIFGRVADYQRFCREVDPNGLPDAGGYCHWESNGFVYIVMNRCGTRKSFYELLVHEATHGFLSRYLSPRRIPKWVNEGLAEYMAGRMVPGCGAVRRVREATRQAARGRGDVMRIFREVRLEAFDYGLAQSLVQFMIAGDRKGFVKFITLLKQGKPEADALKEALGVSHEELAAAWRRAAKKAVR